MDAKNVKKSSKNKITNLAVLIIVLFSLEQPAYSQLNSYIPPFGYNQYQSPGNVVTTCSDLQCAVDECCIETHRSPYCVNLVYSNYQAYCPRLKKCSSNLHCPANTCCVQAIDPTMATTCKSSQAVSNRPGGYTGYPMTRTGPDAEGYCQRAVATGQLCYLPLQGSETGQCPCSDSYDECKPSLQPFTAGICQKK